MLSKCETKGSQGRKTYGAKQSVDIFGGRQSQSQFEIIISGEYEDKIGTIQLLNNYLLLPKKGSASTCTPKKFELSA